MIIQTETYGVADDGTHLHWKIAQPNGSGPWPWVILIHGGGFKSGSPEKPFTICGPDLVNAGYFIASIEYRLAPPGLLSGQTTDGRYPDQTDDCELAVAQAKTDPRCNGSVSALGGSAGGSHVMWLGARSLIRSAVALSPATQFDDPVSLKAGYFNSDVNNYAPGNLAAASPDSILTATESPIFIVAFQQDNMPAPQYSLATSKLSSTGAAHQELLLSGAGHSFDAWPLVKTQAIAFLNANK